MIDPTASGPALYFSKAYRPKMPKKDDPGPFDKPLEMEAVLEAVKPFVRS